MQLARPFDRTVFQWYPHDQTGCPAGKFPDYWTQSTTCIDWVCGTDERVAVGSECQDFHGSGYSFTVGCCVGCAPGKINIAFSAVPGIGGNPVSGGPTTCDEVSCSDMLKHVQDHACVPCPDGKVNSDRASVNSGDAASAP